jgi:alkylhydroperoxidase family enzyme
MCLFDQINKGGKDMASIKMIDENSASGKVKEIYDEIKKSLGIDFVPNLYKVMAHNPDYLEVNWNKSKTVMHQNGKLDAVTKEAIAIAVATTMGCDY